MAVKLDYACIWTPAEIVEHGTVVVDDDGHIAYVGPMESAPRVNGLRLDMRNRIVAPGLIDVHTHGGKGVTFGQRGHIAADLATYAQWVVSTGVTGFLCSVEASDRKQLLEIVSETADVLEAGVQGAQPLGIHLEGPYLNPDKKGAFDSHWLRKPSLDEVDDLLRAGRGWVRQMTLAPELPNALQVAARLRAAGVVAAMGHTNADYDTASAALRSDFTHVTHTFNAQRGFQHREPGVFGAILNSEHVTAEMIADGVHLHPGAMKVVMRCLSSQRVVLITDAMAGAGLADGEYELAGQKVLVNDMHATLADGTLAGSVATLNQCVRNVHQLVGVPLREALQMASLNPARCMGFADRLGSLTLGKDANLIVIDEDMHVQLTMVRGKLQYAHIA